MLQREECYSSFDEYGDSSGFSDFRFNGAIADVWTDERTPYRANGKKIRQVRKILLAKWEKCGNLRGAAGMPAGEIYKHETRI